MRLIKNKMNLDILKQQKFVQLSEQEIEAIPRNQRSWFHLLRFQTLSPEFLLRHRRELSSHDARRLAVEHQIVPRGLFPVSDAFYFRNQLVDENLIVDDGRDLRFPWETIFEYQFHLSEQFILANWNRVNPMVIARYQTWPKSKPIIENPIFFANQAIEGGNLERAHPYFVVTRVPQNRTAKFFKHSFIENLEPFVQNLFNKEAWRAICTRHVLSNDFIIRYRNFGTFSFGIADQNFSLETCCKYARHINWGRYFKYNKHITHEIFKTFYHCRYYNSALRNPACKFWLEPGVIEYNVERPNGSSIQPNHSSLYLASALNLPQLQNMMRFNVDVDVVKEMLLADNVVLEVVQQERRPTISKSFWRFIWKWCTLSEGFIEKIAFPNWLHVVKYQNLSTDFINKYWNKFPLKFLARYQKLDEAQVARLLAYEDTSLDKLLLQFQTAQLIKMGSNPFVEFILDQYQNSTNPPACFRLVLQKMRPASFKYTLQDFWPLEQLVANHRLVRQLIGHQPIPYEFFAAHPEYINDFDVVSVLENTAFPEWFIEQYSDEILPFNIAARQKLSVNFIKKWWRWLDMDDVFAHQPVDREIVERFFNPKKHHYFEVLRNPRANEIVQIIQSVYPNLRRPLLYYKEYELW